ncbi:MAG: DUF6084 family protein [Pyrinomonadaceae bacterium]
MPELDFAVEKAEAVTFAAAPTLNLKLRVTNGDEREQIQSIALRCQINIEPTKRRYTEDEQKKLYELFGAPERWSQTLRSMLWTNTFINVPSFASETTIDLPVACSFDFNVGATKYFAGLETGEIPIILFFSGTVFYDAGAGLQIAQISWDREAKFRFPVSVWQEMMNHYYPNSAWLNLRRDVFDRLYQYKIESGAADWEQALEKLLTEKERVQKV